jgi:hypothetical protein
MGAVASPPGRRVAVHWHRLQPLSPYLRLGLLSPVPAMCWDRGLAARSPGPGLWRGPHRQARWSGRHGAVLNRRVSYAVVVKRWWSASRLAVPGCEVHFDTTIGDSGRKLVAMQRVLRREDCPACGGEKSVQVFPMEMTIEEASMPPGEEKFCSRCRWSTQTRPS